jgi:CDP-diacylglycerol--glycerol-3-phosphate 3-phosphatidyltransferase
MVSYARARAEALGVECKVGVATRPVRVVVLSIGLVFAKGAGLGDFELLEASIYALAGLTVLTVAQRIWHVREELNRRARGGADAAELPGDGARAYVTDEPREGSST